MNRIEVAMICHEVNRAYCAAVGDDSQVAWHDAPVWQRDSAVIGVEFHLARPNASPSASHEAWLTDKQASGWKWGPEKKGNEKEHPCMVPFDELPKEQQIKDWLFRAVVHACRAML